jgi:hypothetical protein
MSGASVTSMRSADVPTELAATTVTHRSSMNGHSPIGNPRTPAATK